MVWHLAQRFNSTVWLAGLAHLAHSPVLEEEVFAPTILVSFVGHDRYQGRGDRRGEN